MSSWKYHLLEGISSDSVLRNYLHPTYTELTLACRIISQQELTGYLLNSGHCDFVEPQESLLNIICIFAAVTKQINNQAYETMLDK